jgi:hypothetical protein
MDHVVCMEDDSYKILVGKSDGKRLIRSRHSCKDNIKINLKETGMKV